MTDYLLANLGRRNPAQFDENLRVVHSATDADTVLALLEIDEDDPRDEWRQVRAAFDDTHRIIGEGLFNPILVPRGRELWRTRFTRACDGVAHYSPHRTIVEVTLAPAGKGLPPETVLSVHVPRLPPPGEAPERIRDELAGNRVEARAKLRRRISARLDQGEAVVWLLDGNADELPPFVRHARGLFTAPPDFGRAAAPAGHRVEMGAAVFRDLWLDGHNLRGRRGVRFPRG